MVQENVIVWKEHMIIQVHVKPVMDHAKVVQEQLITYALDVKQMTTGLILIGLALQQEHVCVKMAFTKYLLLQHAPLVTLPVLNALLLNVPNVPLLLKQH